MRSVLDRDASVPDDTTSPNVAKNRLSGSGIVVVVGTFFGPVIEGVLLFWTAGRLDLPRAWLFLAVSFIGVFGNIAVVALANPELVNHRGRWRAKKDSKPWDKTFVTTYGLTAFYILPIVMGLDVGRYGWSHLGSWAAWVGTSLFLSGSAVMTWAMLVNTHFEVSVRIQTDRRHRVVTTGPYAVIRHPGYIGATLLALGSPLIVGSAYGLIPAAFAAGVLFLRTRREDDTLQTELPGYADYAEKVRHRLLPGIW